MRKWLIALFALSATTVYGAPAWKWVDANGQVHFSDRPMPGAERIELAGAQAFTGGATSRAAPGASAPSSPPSRTGAQAPYQAIDIVSPAEQETLWNTGTVLNVQVRFQPNLQPGHRFDLAFDGQRRNLNTANGRVTLQDVFRGTHTLQVVVIDLAGTELMRSPVRNFVVQQTSVLNPNNSAPPANRPPNRP